MIKSPTIMITKDNPQNDSQNKTYKKQDKQKQPSNIISFRAHLNKHSIPNLKPRENIQIPSIINKEQPKQTNDNYLQKVMKVNLQKITKLRTQYEKQKQLLEDQIKVLKKQNNVLKLKVDELNSMNYQGKQKKTLSISALNKQYNPSDYKNNNDKLSSYEKISPSFQKICFIHNNDPNPQKILQNTPQFKEFKLKINLLEKQNQQVKYKNTQLMMEVRQLNLNVENLRKDMEKVKSLAGNRIGKVQEACKNSVCIQTDPTPKKVVNCQVPQININQKLLPMSQVISSIPNDKKLIKLLQKQVKQRQFKLYQKDRMIDELNIKVMDNGLIGLNSKYKYLMKI